MSGEAVPDSEEEDSDFVLGACNHGSEKSIVEKPHLCAGSHAFTSELHNARRPQQ